MSHANLFQVDSTGHSVALIVVLPVFFPSGYYFRVGALIFVNALSVVGLWF